MFEKLSCQRNFKLDEWESEESNVSISNNSVYDSVAYDLVKTRLLESKVEVEEPANHEAWN